MKNGEKRVIPNTNPEREFYLPKGMTNSTVDEHGRAMKKDDWAFDEWDDPEEEQEDGGEKTGWDDIAENS